MGTAIRYATQQVQKIQRKIYPAVIPSPTLGIFLSNNSCSVFGVINRKIDMLKRTLKCG